MRSQAEGGGGGGGQAVPPQFVSEDSDQRAEREQPADDRVLPAVGGAQVAAAAGFPRLCVQLLLCAAGRRPVCALGLEELSHGSQGLKVVYSAFPLV